METCLAYLLLVPVLGALGVGLGSFAFLVNHLFRTRIDTVHRILRGRPGISFVTGIAVTILALGLIMMLAAAPGLQLLVLLVFLLGLVCFAAGAVTRFCAHRMEADPAEEDLPGPASHLKAGLLISLANLLPFAGSLLVLGLALAGTGAVLLGYFASAGRAAASLAPEPEGPGNRETPSLE